MPKIQPLPRFVARVDYRRANGRFLTYVFDGRKWRKWRKRKRAA